MWLLFLESPFFWDKFSNVGFYGTLKLVVLFWLLFYTKLVVTFMLRGKVASTYLAYFVSY